MESSLSSRINNASSSSLGISQLPSNSKGQEAGPPAPVIQVQHRSLKLHELLDISNTLDTTLPGLKMLTSGGTATTVSTKTMSTNDASANDCVSDSDSSVDCGYRLPSRAECKRVSQRAMQKRCLLSLRTPVVLVRGRRLCKMSRRSSTPKP